MSKSNSRKSYTREFKLEAVRLSEQPDKFIADVARELGIRESDLHTWRKLVREHGDDVFPGHGHPMNDGVVQLRKENARLREENEILKKAAIFFAKESGENTSS